VLGRLRTTSPRTLVRFVFTGAIVAVVHVSVMVVLVGVLDAPVQPSLVAAYCAAVSLHFAMNRNLVFASDGGYALHLSAQGVRYLALALASYAITAASLAVLPGALDLPVLVVYLATIASVSVLNFVVMQSLVFHPAPARHELRDGTSSRSSLSSKP
jgi:putative flippase GtrA